MCAQNGRARERKVGGMEQKKDRSVLIISAVIVAAFVIFGAVAPEALNEVANVLFTVFTVDFGWLYLLVVFVMVIYAVAGLALGYFAFRLDRPFLVSSAFEPLLGEKVHGPIGKAMQIVADEENVNKGSIELSKANRLSADACIVAEPTDLAICYGNRGFTSFFVRTYGKAAHSCDPSKGVNAIYKMARVISNLEDFSLKLNERTNEQLGHVTLNVGVIRGGVSTNSIPAECEIEVESRVFPGMDAQTMKKEIQEAIGDDAEVVVRSNLLASLVPVDSEIVQTASGIEEETLGRKAVIKEFSACSEASFFSVGYGMPTILLGPGDISVAHKPNEFVPLSDIASAVKIYVQMIDHYRKRDQ